MLKLLVLQGSFINALAIIGGALIGLLLPKLQEKYKSIAMQAIGMAVLVIGIDMALDTENSLIMIGSAVLGGLLGEAIRIDKALDQLGKQVEALILSGQARRKRAKEKNKEEITNRLRQADANISNGDGESAGDMNPEEGKIAKGFIFATLIYCVGSMAIVGALESGLLLEHTILYTKAMLDGFSAIIFASTMGIGVALSALPVFIYQGLIALSASLLSGVLSDPVINEIRAVGGLLIIGIGLNLLEIKEIRVVNLLPAVFIAGILAFFLL